jgi:prostaglandin-endoperoxide synthase 2
LLSEHVFNESTFSKAGLEVIEETSSLQDVLNRNLPEGDDKYIAMMTRPEAERC